MTEQPTDPAPAAMEPPPPPAIEPPPMAQPEAAPTPKPGSKRAVVVIGLIIAFLAVVLFVTKDAGSADDLKVGDCFDIPTSTTVSTVTHHPCNEPHTAEVFHVVEFSGSDMTTPLTFVIDNFVESSCTPAFATYTGKAIDAAPDLTYGWFYPTIEGWQQGDRTITCYVTNADESPMSTSVRAGAP